MLWHTSHDAFNFVTKKEVFFENFKIQFNSFALIPIPVLHKQTLKACCEFQMILWWVDWHHRLQINRQPKNGRKSAINIALDGSCQLHLYSCNIDFFAFRRHFYMTSLKFLKFKRVQNSAAQILNSVKGKVWNCDNLWCSLWLSFTTIMSL
jgi:hypothetical protein